jgi:hypothetical protein
LRVLSHTTFLKKRFTCTQVSDTDSKSIVHHTRWQGRNDDGRKRSRMQTGTDAPNTRCKRDQAQLRAHLLVTGFSADAWHTTARVRQGPARARMVPVGHLLSIMVFAAEYDLVTGNNKHSSEHSILMFTLNHPITLLLEPPLDLIFIQSSAELIWVRCQ